MELENNGFVFDFDFRRHTCKLLKCIENKKVIIVPSRVKGCKVLSISNGFLNNENFDKSKIEGVIFPDSITEIEQMTFYNAQALKFVKLPKNITKIENYMFERCFDLSTITIPAKVTDVQFKAFAGSGLETVEFERSLTGDTVVIAGKAFENCTNLKKVVIPNNISKIEKSSFKGCDLLEFYTEKKSYAEKYAKRNNIKVVHIDADGLVLQNNTK